MADIVQVAADVRIDGDNSSITKAQFGETVVAGNCVYRKASDDKYWLADCVTDSETATVAGIVVTANVADGWGVICVSGDIDLGTASALTIGLPYVLSEAGGISLTADLTTGDHVSHLGYAITTDIITLSPVNDIVTL